MHRSDSFGKLVTAKQVDIRARKLYRNTVDELICIIVMSQPLCRGGEGVGQGRDLGYDTTTAFSFGVYCLSLVISETHHLVNH